MVSLAELVNDSLARHGVKTQLDPRRLQWSKWFRCEDSLSAVLVPSKAGIFCLAHEVLAPGEMAFPGASETSKRMLALSLVAEADDLGMALGRLFLPGTPEHEHLKAGRCFARYAVIEDDQQRQCAHAALLQWMEESTEAATGIGKESKWEFSPEKSASSTFAFQLLRDTGSTS